MSRQPSPGNAHLSNPAQGQIQSAKQQKPKPYSGGITAGAEDAKYHNKYKELKRKVKEIESDNDKLQLKVMQAKRNIQRMKLERAILYERLSVAPHPHSPELQDRQPLPPIAPQGQPLPSSHHHREGPPIDHDPGLVEYMRIHGNARVVAGPDGRPVPVADPSLGPAVAPATSSMRSTRRSSAGVPPAHDARLGAIPPLPPMQPPMEPGRSHSTRSHSHTTSPTIHHSHVNSPHERSHSGSRRGPSAPYAPHSYPVDNLPPVGHVMLSSPPPSDRERSRRQDMHELAIPHGDIHNHAMGPLSPRSHSSDTRSSSSRVHNHQRLGPGTYINREDHRDRQREIEYDAERQWEIRERDRRDMMRGGREAEMGPAHMHSPPVVHRSSRHSMEYTDHHTSRMREEPGYYHEMSGSSASAGPGYPMHSRSETPGSGSGGSGSGIGGADGPSRPDSRGQYYDHDRPRSFRLRPVSQAQAPSAPPQEELDFVHEDGRSQSRDRGGGGGGVYTPSEQGRSSARIDARKRRSVDMMDVDDPAMGGLYPGQDRGAKRYHRERVRGGEDQDDDRMGP
ncbi:uncharacterized protein EV420DRAFT_131488 [Desarmillaria tabescens]|uniref:INO80 complex subunit F domain-containing protein n=1 Tax=Armillaria tabescens TaxID=1929756 RepID=A0AA39NA31_ARMTA|nr:uncharacterized protein EV420DRAFT_131488 [Desarmillaria tabescens]KAK0461822.1 hypothetical protein EV420DRAFT_131488 [Desarmillaria tabescens]